MLIIGKNVELTQIHHLSKTEAFAQNSHFSTFIGGSEAEGSAKITLDPDGNIIVCGQTASLDFPTTDDAFQDTYAGGMWDGFISKFDISGNLLFSTYIGGNVLELITSISIDNQGNIVIVGSTSSPDFPVTEDAYDSTLSGAFDGFISKISPEGELIYSTYFGGDDQDEVFEVRFDDDNNYMFVGWTLSDGLATSGVFQEQRAGETDGFAARLSVDGQTLQMFTYYGGEDRDDVHALVLDSEFNFIMIGLSQKMVPTYEIFKDRIDEGIYVYLAIIDYDGNSLNYSTYLGQSVRTTAPTDPSKFDICLDSDGGIIVTGDAVSENFTTTEGAYQQTPQGKSDVFIARITPTRELDFCTRLAGNATDWGRACCMDSEDNVIVAGSAASYDFPTVNAPQPNKGKSSDAFVARISFDGSSLQDSTFAGGEGSDYGDGLAIDADGNIIITGTTTSDDFPITSGAYQENIAGSRDIFVSYVTFTSENTTSTTTTTTNGNDDTIYFLLIAGGLGTAVVVISLIVIMRIRR